MVLRRIKLRDLPHREGPVQQPGLRLCRRESLRRRRRNGRSRRRRHRIHHRHQAAEQLDQAFDAHGYAEESLREATSTTAAGDLIRAATASPRARRARHDRQRHRHGRRLRRYRVTSATRASISTATTSSPRSPPTTPSCSVSSRRAASRPEEARFHPRRSVLMRVLSDMDAHPEVDIVHRCRPSRATGGCSAPTACPASPTRRTSLKAMRHDLTPGAHGRLPPQAGPRRRRPRQRDGHHRRRRRAAPALLRHCHDRRGSASNPDGVHIPASASRAAHRLAASGAPRRTNRSTSNPHRLPRRAHRRGPPALAPPTHHRRGPVGAGHRRDRRGGPSSTAGPRPATTSEPTRTAS